jgi:hypothetical protein
MTATATAADRRLLLLLLLTVLFCNQPNCDVLYMLAVQLRYINYATVLCMRCQCVHMRQSRLRTTSAALLPQCALCSSSSSSTGSQQKLAIISSV